MHLLIIRLEMLTWKLLFRSVVVCHMCNICPFCCPTFQTEPQTPSTGTQTGAASMPSVTSLTVTWRGERNKVPVHPNTRLAWHYSFFFIIYDVHCSKYLLWFLTSIPGLSWPPDCWPTRFSHHRSGRPCKLYW